MLTKRLYEHLSDPLNVTALGDRVRIKSVRMINQDEYFYPEDSPNHKWLERLKHINWEILSALNMPKMMDDIQKLLGPDYALYTTGQSPLSNEKPSAYVNILIVEGFTIFNHLNLVGLFQIKFHLHLPYEKCFDRRSVRVYQPADVVGYFESCVWPQYVKHFNEYRQRKDLIVLNGEVAPAKCFDFVLQCIIDALRG